MRLLSPLLASLFVLGPTSCKRNAEPGVAGSTTADDGPRLRGRRRMPRPLPLPAKPEGLIHVTQPGAVARELLAYAPKSPSARELLGQALESRGGSLERELAAHVDFGRPWTVAQVGGQTIIHLPLQNTGIAPVKAALSAKKPAGNFGAVELDRPSGGPGLGLAYLDPNAATLTLAADLRGIATGPKLDAAYGRTKINVMFSQAQAAAFGFELPVGAVAAQGSALTDLKVTVSDVPQLPETAWMQRGALRGLLKTTQFALAATTRYRDYRTPVEKVISRAKRETAKQNFLIRGTLEDMTRRLASSLRSWNGRVFAAVGPANHLAVGMGANDPERMGRSVQFLIRGVVENIKTINALGAGAPRVRFRPNAAKAAGQRIHIASVDGARRYLPADFRALATQEGRLKLAMAFPPWAGAGMVVAGGNAQQVLTQWLEDTKSGLEHDTDSEHFAAASIAVSPRALQRVTEQPLDISAVLGLTPNRDPLQILVVRENRGYVLSVQRLTTK